MATGGPVWMKELVEMWYGNYLLHILYPVHRDMQVDNMELSKIINSTKTEEYPVFNIQNAA